MFVKIEPTTYHQVLPYHAIFLKYLQQIFEIYKSYMLKTAILIKKGIKVNTEDHNLWIFTDMSTFRQL